MVVDAAQSKCAVFLLRLGGLVQPGGSSSHVFIVLLTVLDPPAGVHRHLMAAACASFNALSAAHFAAILTLRVAFWGASKQLAGMWYWFFPQMLQSCEVTNTTLSAFDVLVGQVIPAVLSVWPVAFAAKPGGGVVALDCLV